MPSITRTTLTSLVVAAAICVTLSRVSAQESPAIAKHTRWVTSLTFSNDGAILASTGGERSETAAGLGGLPTAVRAF